MNLKDFAAKHGLEQLPTSAKEIGELLSLADQKVHDAEIVSTTDVSADFYHETVYAISIPCAKAVIRSEGYVVPKTAKDGHVLIFEFMYTAFGNRQYSNAIFAARKSRNQTAYSSKGSASKDDTTKLLKLFRELRAAVESWIRKHHSELFETPTEGPNGLNDSNPLGAESKNPTTS